MYRITSYGTGMTPRHMDLPEGTTEEEAIAEARSCKEDPYFGFSSLTEVRNIEVG